MYFGTQFIVNVTVCPGIAVVVAGLIVHDLKMLGMLVMFAVK
jgi:hypothetical protein